ncbi:UNVERIFIED_CONTAM: putative RNA methyltransferase [Sesamum latifolium]|uniref:RNA methyltransferase n=1 Tax=Sesamum latifolium TaxID=2727402 RepID=A0AAW2SN43_9LAMI
MYVQLYASNSAAQFQIGGNFCKAVQIAYGICSSVVSAILQSSIIHKLRCVLAIAYGLWELRSSPVAKATTLLHKVNLFDQFPPFFFILFSPPFTVSIFFLQRALPIRIMTVGKKRSPGVQLIVDEYIEKLKHYCPVEDVRIKSNPKNARDVMAQIEHEDIAVMGLIKSNEWVVMLDERGINMGSEQMASLIGDAGNTGASSILFCIGGPYGHGRQLRERANVSIKLSSLVLNHEVALVVLVEQLYRPEVSSLGDVTPSSVKQQRRRDDSIHGCTLNMQPILKAVENIVVNHHHR